MFMYPFWYHEKCLPVPKVIIHSVKALGGHHLNFSAFKKLCGCHLPQWGLIVGFWRVTYSLDNSLGCLELISDPFLVLEASFSDKRCPVRTPSPPLFGGFIQYTLSDFKNSWTFLCWEHLDDWFNLTYFFLFRTFSVFKNLLHCNLLLFTCTCMCMCVMCTLLQCRREGQRLVFSFLLPLCRSWDSNSYCQLFSTAKLSHGLFLLIIIFLLILCF